MMGSEDKKHDPAESGVKVREYYHGAWNGEFPTIIVATLTFVAGGIATGVLSAIGKDVWETLKKWLKRRYHNYEQDRQSKKGTRKPRNRVMSIFFVAHIKAIPIIYYMLP